MPQKKEDTTKTTKNPVAEDKIENKNQVTENKTAPKEEATKTAENKKAVLVKIKFLKNHKMVVGSTKISAKRDQEVEVERHIATTLVNRNIAVII